MRFWVSIVLAVICWFFAFAQFRLILVYKGKVQSPTVGPFISEPTHLIAIAWRSALTFTALGFVFVIFPFPLVLTYIAIVFTVRALIDGVLASFKRGVLKDAPLLPSFAKVIGAGVWLGLFVYFFGY